MKRYDGKFECPLWGLGKTVLSAAIAGVSCSSGPGSTRGFLLEGNLSVKVMGHVYGLQLSHNEQSVLLALADHANHDGGDIFPSLGLVAWKTGYSKMSVRRIIDRLQKTGILVLEGNEKGGRGKTNCYKIDMLKGNKKIPFMPQKRVTSCDPLDSQKGNILSVKGNILSVKGNTAVLPESVEPSHEPSKVLPPNGVSDHKRFISQWSEAFKDHWESSYVFAGGKDGAAVKRLIATGESVDALITLARRAWSECGEFNRGQAASIAGFAGRLNHIRVELKGKVPPLKKKPHPWGPEYATYEEMGYSGIKD